MVGSGFAAEYHTSSWRHVRDVDASVVAVTSLHPERARAFAHKHGIPQVFDTLEDLLAAADVDVVDLCVPTICHVPMTLQALRAGKHVIVEKPFTGYCGEPGDDPDALIGYTVPRPRMLESVMASCREVEAALNASGRKLCYAENWVYAPTVQKARRLVESSPGTILRMVAEESHPGSHASYAKYWRLAGGGSLLRTGSHPIGGVCYLKQVEGLAKYGAPIRPTQVVAQTAFLTRIESFVREPVKYLNTGLVDCEDWGAALITFEDGSVAQVTSSDVVLGGVYNHLDVFLSTGRIQCRINPHDALMAYGPFEGAWGEEYLAEKISTRAGWSYPAPDEHWNNGYQQELQDFAEAIVYDRPPMSGWALARDVTAVIFTAYLSAAEGRVAQVPRDEVTP